MNVDRYRETWLEDTEKPLWKRLHTVYHTPKGDLHSVYAQSAISEPGYILEYLLREPSKNGDVRLGRIVEKYGSRIGWEGNIEIQERLFSEPDRVRASLTNA